MFQKKVNLSDHDVGTPSVSTPGTVGVTPGTPGLTSSFMVSTPAPLTPAPLTPAPVTPAPSLYAPPELTLAEEDGAGSGSVDELPPTSQEESEDAESLYKKLTMQNLFGPQDISAGLGSQLTQWVMTPNSEPVPNENVVTKMPEGATNVDSLQLKLGATMPVIHNVVATASLCCELELKKIAMAARNAEYNPRRFSAVIMRVRDPKSTALVFKSGRLVVTGTTSKEQALQAARKFGRIIKKVGYSDVVLKGFKVENLVSTFKVPFPIHLEQLYQHLPAATHSQYEPEVFPGLICRVPDTSESKKEKKGTLLIFVSGKCVMIGMKTKKDIEDAYGYILPFLDRYRKSNKE